MFEFNTEYNSGYATGLKNEPSHSNQVIPKLGKLFKLGQAHIPPIGNALFFISIINSLSFVIISSHTSGLDIGFLFIELFRALYIFPSEPKTNAGVLYVVLAFHSYAPCSKSLDFINPT